MKDYLYEMLRSTGALSTQDIAMRIIASLLFGLAIFISYRITHKGSIYSRKFNITLLILTVLTTMVMTVIGNNIALSLGMVGALSIIRFRTSIKDSRDTVYIFWTIIIGICCGVGDFTVAAIGSSAVFLILMAFGQVKNESRMLLIIRCDREVVDAIRKILMVYFVHPPVLKVENSSSDKVELIYELNRKMLSEAEDRESRNAADHNREPVALVNKIHEVHGVDYANLVSQQDEIT